MRLGFFKANKTKESPQNAGAQRQYPLDHVGIIMDGNRRWADRRGLPRLAGHKAGAATLKSVVKHAGERGLRYLTVYAFSTENWSRVADEVSYLFDLMLSVLRDELDELTEGKARFRAIGQLDALPESLQASIREATARTGKNTGLNLQVAINYGSRQEISLAARQIAEEVMLGKLSLSEITPELVSSRLYTTDIPDPDLIIRTGGEMRLSNYLLWQSAYSEIYVTPVLWPDFTPGEFERAIAEFALRDRRWGGD